MAALIAAAAAHPEAASVASLLLSADHHDGSMAQATCITSAACPGGMGTACPATASPRGERRASGLLRLCRGGTLSPRRLDQRRRAGRAVFLLRRRMSISAFACSYSGRQCWYEPGQWPSTSGGAASGKSERVCGVPRASQCQWAFLKNMPSSLLRRYLAPRSRLAWFRSVVRGARSGRDDCASQVGRLATAAGGACDPARGASHENRFGRAVAGRAQSGGVDTADLAGACAVDGRR